MDYTAQGHRVGLAARMEQLAEMVYVSPTAQRCRRRGQCRSRLGRASRMVIGRGADFW